MTVLHRQLKIQPVEPPRKVVRQAVEEMNGETFEFTEELEVYRDFVSDLKPWQADAATRALADVCRVLLNTNEFLYVR